MKKLLLLFSLAFLTFGWSNAAHSAHIFGQIELDGFDLKFKSGKSAVLYQRLLHQFSGSFKVNIREYTGNNDVACEVRQDGTYSCSYNLQAGVKVPNEKFSFVLTVSDIDGNIYLKEILTDLRIEDPIEHILQVPWEKIFTIEGFNSALMDQVHSGAESPDAELKRINKFLQTELAKKKARLESFEENAHLIPQLEEQNDAYRNKLQKMRRDSVLAHQNEANLDNIIEQQKVTIQRLEKTISKGNMIPRSSICNCTDLSIETGSLTLFLSLENLKGNHIMPQFQALECRTTSIDGGKLETFPSPIVNLDKIPELNGLFVTVDIRSLSRLKNWEMKVYYSPDQDFSLSSNLLESFVYSSNENPCVTAPIPNLPWHGEKTPSVFLFGNDLLNAPAAIKNLPKGNYKIKISSKVLAENKPFEDSHLTIFREDEKVFDSNFLENYPPLQKDSQRFCMIYEGPLRSLYQGTSEFFFLDFDTKIRVIFKVEILNSKTNQRVGDAITIQGNGSGSEYFQVNLH